MGGGGGFGNSFVGYPRRLIKSAPNTISRSRRGRGHIVESGTLALTREVARTRHASPATLCCRHINVGMCLSPLSTANSDQFCVLPWGCALVPYDCVPMWTVLVGQSYALVVIDDSIRLLIPERLSRFGQIPRSKFTRRDLFAWVLH